MRLLLLDAAVKFQITFTLPSYLLMPWQRSLGADLQSLHVFSTIHHFLPSDWLVVLCVLSPSPLRAALVVCWTLEYFFRNSSRKNDYLPIFCWTWNIFTVLFETRRAARQRVKRSAWLTVNWIITAIFTGPYIFIRIQ